MLCVSFRVSLHALLRTVMCAGVLWVGSPPSKVFAQKKSGRCDLATQFEARISKVYPGGTLELQDGRRVRLVNLVYPKPSKSKIASVQKTSTERPQEFVSWLRRYLLGQKVELAFGQNDQHFDRYDRLLAHVFFKYEGNRVWVQKKMVEKKLAMIRPWPKNRSCLRKLMDVEQLTFNRMKSIRKDGFCRGKAEYLGHLYSNKHHFCVVRGKVHKVTRTRKNIYINFAENWRKDFTAVLPVKALKTFRAAGIKPKDFTGEQVEIRGWLDVWNGPFIRIKQPEQIKPILNRP